MDEVYNSGRKRPWVAFDALGKEAMVMKSGEWKIY
jgi:hypothetical protein